MRHRIVRNLGDGDKVDAAGLILIVPLVQPAGDSAVLVDIQDVDIRAVDIAVEPVEDLLGLLLFNGVAIEAGAVGIIEVIITAAGDRAVGIEVNVDGVFESAAFGVDPIELLTFAAVDGDAEAAVGKAEDSVDIIAVGTAADAVRIGTVKLHGTDGVGAVIDKDDVAVLVQLHIIGIEPLILLGRDEGAGQLIAVLIEAADIILLLVLLPCPVFVTVKDGVALAVVPRGADDLNGDKAAVGETDAVHIAAGSKVLAVLIVRLAGHGLVLVELREITVIVDTVKKGCVNIVLAFILGGDALGDVLADLLIAGGVHSVGSHRAYVQVIFPVLSEILILGGIDILRRGLLIFFGIRSAGLSAAAAGGKAQAHDERQNEAHYASKKLGVLHFILLNYIVFRVYCTIKEFRLSLKLS